MTVQTLDQLLTQRALSFADKTCIVSTQGGSKSNNQLTYGQLNQRATDLAISLYNSGCRQGDSVLLGLGNSNEFFVALFACFSNGLIAVPVDANLAVAELEVITSHANPKAIVVDSSCSASFDTLADTCQRLTLAQGGQLEGVQTTLQETNERQAVVNLPETPALMLYTSGTTGNPKAVQYTHAMLLSKINSIQQWFDFDESYTSLCLLPTHFGHGLICNCLSVFAYAGTLVITPPFNLDLLKRLWTIINDHKVNHFSSVPTILRLLLKFGGHEASGISESLKFITCASAPLSPRELEGFQDTFGVPILNCYGLTETSGWSACSPRTPNRDLASVGKAINGEFRVVDSTGQPLPIGEKGELQIKGPSVMTGYHKNAGVAVDAVQDGWFSTGDIGQIDADGAIFLHARVKELIIRAGKNIYPAEVDHILMSHPQVAEACAVGLADDVMGEKVAACVVLNNDSSLDESELIIFSQEKLAAYKCPQRIRFVDKIPKNARGKVNRLQLRSLFTA